MEKTVFLDKYLDRIGIKGELHPDLETLKNIQKQHLINIPFENTYAIGDSTNDLPMLKYVKNSIAMGNSNPLLFDLVSYVTTDIEEDGIYKALKHYSLI